MKQYQTNRVIFAFLTVFISSQALAGDSVGHGGDGIRFLFRSSKQSAALRVMKFVSVAPKRDASDKTKAWIMANGKNLSLDILSSQHEWVENKTATCASTNLQPNSAITLSYPTCGQSEKVTGAATKVLIHESVHHLGIADEAFADSVADAVYANTLPEYECNIARGWLNGTTPFKKFNINYKKTMDSTPITGTDFIVNTEIDSNLLGIHIWKEVSGKANVTAYNYTVYGGEQLIVSNQDAQVWVSCKLQ